MKKFLKHWSLRGRLWRPKQSLLALRAGIASLTLAMTLLVLAMTLILLSPAFSWQISDFGVGARCAALGTSGLAEEANSFGNFLNPASLCKIETINLNSIYLKISEEVSFKSVGLNFPTELGVFAFSYIQSGVEGIYQTILDENNRPKILNTFGYDTNFFTLGWARNFDNFRAGLSLKYQKQNLGSLGAASGYNADLGVIYPISETQNVAAVLRNFIPGQWGGLKWSTGFNEKMPLVLSLGFHQKFEGFKIFTDFNFSKELPFNLHAGCELQAVELLALRIGLDQVIGFGATSVGRLTLGLGLDLGFLTLDYAYLPDAFGFENFTHYFSATVKFPVQ